MLQFLVILFVIYLAITAFFVIQENRRPQSTYAWLLAFTTVPLVGVILYLFTGRGWKAFSQERDLARKTIGEELAQVLRKRLMAPEEISQRLATEQPQSFNPNLMHLVAHNSASMLSAHNQVTILQDAEEFYPALLEDLRRARHHIHLQYYIWTDDTFTQQVKEVLIERAQAGVQVRALYDASSGGVLGKTYIEELRAAGIEVLPYLAYNSLRSLHLANYRCHRKITVIDGHIGYLGGMNLDKEQLSGTLWERWRDTQVRIAGDGTLGLQTAFLTAWENTTQTPIDDKRIYFQPPAEAATPPFLPVQILMSGPDSRWQGIRQLYFYMIVSARSHVYIQSPFFIPDEVISDALKAAALSGVDVRLICTPRGAKYQIPYRAANTYFAELAEAGIKIYLYDHGYYHAKCINMDSTICTIGSCNMDVRSYSLNYELNAVIYDEEKAQELAADFLRDQAASTPFDLQEYQSRPVQSRFYDSLCRLTSPVL